MARKEIGTKWDRENRNNMNDNFKELYDVRGMAIEEAIGDIKPEVMDALIESSKLEWLSPVDSFDDIEITYPSAEIGNVVMARDTGKVYRFDGSEWKEIQQIDPSPINEVDNRLSSQLAQTEKVINVKEELGAVGDGVTDDYEAIQMAIELGEETKRPVYLPSGEYYVSQTLKTKHMTSYNYRFGVKIYGNGKDSIITRKHNRQPMDYSNMEDYSGQAALAIYGSNNVIENLSFNDSKVGVYLGQDPTTTERSSASMNRFNNVWMEYVGTGLLFIHGSGNHYNTFNNMHIIHSQISVHLGKGFFLDQFNNNRNTFTNIRVSRSWIGWLLEQTDGNFFDKVYAETFGSTGAIGPEPVQLPTELEGKKTVIVALDGQYNTFNNFGHEACEWDIYSVGYRNSFVNGMIKDDTLSNLKVMFPDPSRQPLAYRANSYMMGDMIYQPQSGIFFDGSNGTAFKSGRVFDLNYHKQTVDLDQLSEQITDKTSYSRSRINKLGGVVNWMANYRFIANEQMSPEDPIKIKLPLDLEVDFAYKNALTTDVTMPFEAFVGTGGADEKVIGRWSSETESTEFASDHIIIPAPQSGWNIGSNTNYIFFNLSFHSST